MFGRLLQRLRTDQRGTMAIETALVAPMLMALSMGAYEASRIYARQTELQTAIAEAGDVAIAIKVDTDLERSKLRARIKSSTGLSDADVTIANSYRCGTTATTVSQASTCGSAAVTTYLEIHVTDTLTPMWTNLGFGSTINFNLRRLLLVS
ncbi:TadE/TadG family type IV pilus assembly protein [Novosphingobium sp. B 225]|uniref:TadE/TadG family type IV pilus assembly protein n=1 Tax=Novosphingobium sp. B 225 TaxID=1961849 RepID=UPI000B4B7744|nr:TadE/TadG family type IV pilus assembly protein [Novosphingobium sp. B 225]